MGCVVMQVAQHHGAVCRFIASRQHHLLCVQIVSKIIHATNEAKAAGAASNTGARLKVVRDHYLTGFLVSQCVSLVMST